MSPEPAPPAPEADASLPFGKAIERLDAIVREMESGSLALEKTIENFEEGMGLVKQCEQQLQAVERKIELLTRQDDGVKAVPFDDGDPQ